MNFGDCLQVERRSRDIAVPHLCRIYRDPRPIYYKDPWRQKNFGDMYLAGMDFELKAEQRFTGNVFLEEWSNRQHRTPGWMVHLGAERLVYHFLECPERLWVMRFASLQEWFRAHRKRFPLKQQRRTDQLNDTWGRIVPLRQIPGRIVREYRLDSMAGRG